MRRKFCIGMTLCMLLGTAAMAGSADSSQNTGGSNANKASNVSNDKVFANDPVGINIPAVIIITRPDDLTPRTDWVKPVRFYHAMHATQHACYDCHHEETNRYMGEDLDSFTPCSDCHMDEGMLEPMSFYAAWHAKSPISCVGCHWQYHLKGNTVPPISCTRGCHPDAKLSQETISHTAHNLAAPASPSASARGSSATLSSSLTSKSPEIAWEITPRQHASSGKNISSSRKALGSHATSPSSAKDLKE